MKPILFSTPMVRAILDGNKTQTRRVMKLQIEPCQHHLYQEAEWKDKPTEWSEAALKNGFAFCGYCENGVTPKDDYAGIKCPYGKVGDILWVREKWMHGPNYPNGMDKYYYFASVSDQFKEEWPKSWKPSIHMPKDACRLFLKIISIRVQRVNDITKEDAQEEGVEMIGVFGKGHKAYKDYTDDTGYVTTATHSFQLLWIKINGGESWHKNPWVWVVEFEKTDPISF